MTKRILLPPTPPATLAAYLAGPPRISQRALADAVGCNQSMISMLRKGKRVPSAALAVKLHAVTGVPLKALLAPKLRLAGRRPPRVLGRPVSRGDPAQPAPAIL